MPHDAITPASAAAEPLARGSDVDADMGQVARLTDELVAHNRWLPSGLTRR